MSNTESTNGANTMDAINMITIAVVAADLKVDCPKCSGQGVLEGYRHIQHGVCFRCGGSGQVYLDTLPEKYQAPYIREAQEKAERKAARDKAQAERDGLVDMIIAGVELEMGAKWLGGEEDDAGLIDPFSINWDVSDEISRRIAAAEECGLLPEVPEL